MSPTACTTDRWRARSSPCPRARVCRRTHHREGTAGPRRTRPPLRPRRRPRRPLPGAADRGATSQPGSDNHESGERGSCHRYRCECPRPDAEHDATEADRTEQDRQRDDDRSSRVEPTRSRLAVARRINSGKSQVRRLARQITADRPREHADNPAMAIEYAADDAAVGWVSANMRRVGDDRWSPHSTEKVGAVALRAPCSPTKRTKARNVVDMVGHRTPTRPRTQGGESSADGVEQDIVDRRDAAQGRKDTAPPPPRPTRGGGGEHGERRDPHRIGARKSVRGEDQQVPDDLDERDHRRCPRAAQEGRQTGSGEPHANRRAGSGSSTPREPCPPP